MQERETTVAEQIARALFRNSNGDVADRLVRVYASVQGGWWTLQGATLQIFDTLHEEGYVIDRVAEAEQRAKAKSATPPDPLPRRERAQELTADDVEWVVNDSAELGVKIGNQFFFCYKGRSLIYEEGTHDDGKPMMWRPVFKREFGECVHPVNYTDPRKIGTVSLDDSDDWKPLPSSLPPSPLSAVPAECCGAIHEGLTGAVCELAKGHIGNHRGSFGRGHSAQWPVTPLSAQPTAQEPETKPASRATCESHGHIFGPKGCCLFCEAPKPEAAPSVPPATTALREALKEVEWVFIPNPDGTPGLYETCPRCWADRALRGGHRVGCELAAALTATEDTQ